MGVTAVEKPGLHQDPPSNGNRDNTVSWGEFTENTTFHGVKYIFQDSHLSFRRPLWLFVVISSILVFIWQVGIRTGDYFLYKTTTDVEIKYVSAMEFPAVTVCNQNSFRLTAVVDWALYDVIDEIYKTSNISSVDWSQIQPKIADVNYTEFIHAVAHQKSSFITGCQWNGVDCDIEADFSTVLTDLGVCYTFNHANRNQSLYTTEAGQASGLKLLINVEQYEYMRGPQDDAGIKVLLHPRKEAAMISENGFAAAPGAHTLVAMKRSEVNSLEPPFGTCHPDNSPVGACLDQCRAQAIINMCGCRAGYMRQTNGNSTTVCDFYNSVSCVRSALAQIRKVRLECECNPPCVQVRYEHQLSNAQLSEFNIDRIILGNPETRDILRESYRKVRDTSQLVGETWTQDLRSMSYLIDISSTTNQAFIANQDPILDPSGYALSYQHPNIFGPSFAKNDEEIITSQYHTLLEILNLDISDKASTAVTVYTIIQKSVLGVDGISMMLPGKLRDCVANATVSYKNGKMESGSEAENKTWDKWATTACNDFTVGRQTSSFTRWFGVEVESYTTYTGQIDGVLDEFSKTNANAYNDMVQAVFGNSPASPNEQLDHKKCVQGMDCFETILSSFTRLKSLIVAFNVAETIDEFVDSTNEMESIINSPCMKNIPNLTFCSWMQGEMIKAYTSDNSFVALAQMVKQSQNQIFGFLSTLSAQLVQMKENHEQSIEPMMEQIQKYLNGSSVKSELARFFQSKTVKTTISVMPLYFTDFYNTIKPLQGALGDMQNSVRNLYTTLLGLPVPLVSFDKLHQMSLFNIVAESNKSHLMELAFDTSINMTKNIEPLVHMIFSKYQKKYQEVLVKIGEPYLHQGTSLDSISASMTEYAASTQLNVNFFMANFLKLDVFYKDMSYEEISQQEVFTLPSLVGEVGGFMGLLLGASVLTICELLDYIIVKVAHRVCMRGSRVKPRLVQSAPGWDNYA